MQNSINKQSDTAVVLVDMQDFFLKNFLPSVKKTLIENQLRVIDICVKKKLPFIILEYKCRGVFRGSLIQDLDKKIQNVHKEVVIKEHNSGFTKTNLHSILKQLRVKKLLIMGVNANGCVQDTAIGACSRGFKVVTSCGVMGSASRSDLDLSKRNKDWYVCNTIFKKDTDDLINYLHAS